MLNLNELQQFVAFADLGTLSKVAEQCHISTPSITRSMQNVEQSFGVKLFTRSKNKIELNATGQVAVELTRKLLEQAAQTVEQVKAFDQRQKTITVRSCAPAPLWTLMPQLNSRYAGMTIASSIAGNGEVLAAWQDGSCDIAILPFPLEDKNCTCRAFMRENLSVCVPPDHELATHTELSFAEINGFNFLLRTELGFWDALCRRKMPASRFLVQPDQFTFDELVRSSSLPCFTTDYFTNQQQIYPGRVQIPLTDPEARATFYMLIHRADKWE